MMKIIIHLLLFIGVCCMGQTKKPSAFVIASKLNIRNQASIEGEVIGVLNQGQGVERSELDRKEDVVNGKSGYWIPLKYNQGIGYVWNHSLTTEVYNSVINSKKKTMFKWIETNQLRIVTRLDTQIVSDKVHELEWLNSDDNHIYISQYYNLAAYPNKEVFQLSWYNRENKKQNDYIIELNDSNIVLAERHKVVNYATIDTESDPYLFRVSNHGNNNNIIFMTNYPDDHPDTLVVVKENEAVVQNRKWDIVQYEGDDERWIPVNYKKWSGYIQDYYLEKPSQIFPNIYDDKIKYGVSDKYLYYYNGRQFSSETIIQNDIIPQKISLLKSRFLPQVDELISLSYFGESCGVPSGRLVYARTGDKIDFMFHNESMGDGGFGSETIYKIIDTNRILMKQYDNEYLLGAESEEDITLDYNFDVSYELYEWTKDGLEPIESKYDVLSRLASKKDWQIDNQFYFDVNKDGKEDIVGVFRKVEEYSKEGYISFADEAVVVIYLQNEVGGYALYGENHSIYKKGFSATEIKSTPKGFKLEIIYAQDCLGCHVEELEDYGYKAYDFKWQDTSLVLWQTKWINQENYEFIKNDKSWKMQNNMNIEFNNVE